MASDQSSTFFVHDPVGGLMIFSAFFIGLGEVGCIITNGVCVVLWFFATSLILLLALLLVSMRKLHVSTQAINIELERFDLTS